MINYCTSCHKAVCPHDNPACAACMETLDGFRPEVTGVQCVECGGTYCLECEEETKYREGWDNCKHVNFSWGITA